MKKFWPFIFFFSLQTQPFSNISPLSNYSNAKLIPRKMNLRGASFIPNALFQPVIYTKNSHTKIAYWAGAGPDIYKCSVLAYHVFDISEPNSLNEKWDYYYYTDFKKSPGPLRGAASAFIDSFGGWQIIYGGSLCNGNIKDTMWALDISSL
jgi:hypothetical protein